MINLSKTLILALLSLALLTLTLAFGSVQAQEIETAAEAAPELDAAPAEQAAIKGAPAPVEFKRMPRLKVKVNGLTPEAGTVEISLFNSGDTFMLEPFMQESGVPDESGLLEVTFLNVFEGIYGVVVVHDENGNGLYDAGFLGFGAEPVAYSNDARPWLGRPSFDSVSFDVQEDMEITINLD